MKKERMNERKRERKKEMMNGRMTLGMSCYNFAKMTLKRN